MDASPSAQLPTPQVVGAYRLLELVARGGSSAVWRAIGPGGDIVAVKLLDPAASGTPAERRRFLRGFKVASILSHPGIARLIEAGEHDGNLFVVEEYIDGETLAERLRGGRLPVEEALRIVRKTAEILGYAHQSGVVHRDLSPRNLMIDQSGRVVLVDFGIAVRPEGTTQPGSNTLLGTLNYLAPELIKGRAASARSDLYALGAIAYQMLGGSPPFVATQPEALIRLHLKQKPTSLRTLRPELDPRIDRVVLKLLTKLPADRFNNAEAFLRALDEACAPRRRGRVGDAPATPRRPQARDARAVRRLAVVPFTADFDDGSDPDRMARVARGLAETVAAALSGVEGLAVLPPSQVEDAEPTTPGRLADALGVDAVLGAHLVQRDAAQRLSWTLTGRHGAVLEGGRLGMADDTLFAIEDALIAALIRALRRPAQAGRLRSAAGREGWYAPFLEALGCLQRSDHEASVDRAIALLERIRDAGAGGVQVHAALGRAYLRRAEIRREPEWRKCAEKSCRIAISLDPLAPEAMVTMGRLLVSGGRADEGVEILHRALELEPSNVDARVWLSRAHEMRGDMDTACRVADEACTERPDRWFVHDRLAVLHFRSGRYADAAASWRTVLELTPDNAKAWAKLGSSLLELGELEEAEESYRASIEIEPTAGAFDGLGLVRFYQGAMEEAAHWFGRAVELAPAQWRMWAALADAQQRIPGRREEARASLDRAIQPLRRRLAENPVDADAWGNLAVYLAKQDLHAEAFTALERALTLAPKTTGTLGRAILVFELAGRRQEAIARLAELAGRGAIPFSLAAAPELDDLRASPEARNLFPPLPSEQHDTDRLSPRRKSS